MTIPDRPTSPIDIAATPANTASITPPLAYLPPARAALQAQFFAVQDSSYADFHSSLVPNFERSRIIGVRMPQLRKIAKDLATGKLTETNAAVNSPADAAAATKTVADMAAGRNVSALRWQDYFAEVEAAYGHLPQQSDSDTARSAALQTFSAAPLYYEEILTAGLAAAYAKLPLAKRFDWIRRFVPMIDNWAVCDTFCGTWKPKENELAQLWEFLTSQYLSEPQESANLTAANRPTGSVRPQGAADCASANQTAGDSRWRDAAEYDLRYGVVMLLTHFVKREEYIDRILSICDSIDHPAYYVKMAVAWCLSYGFMFFPDKTIAYFRSFDNHLDDFTYNKSIQKACESYRISKDDKELLRTLRR